MFHPGLHLTQQINREVENYFDYRILCRVSQHVYWIVSIELIGITDRSPCSLLVPATRKAAQAGRLENATANASDVFLPDAFFRVPVESGQGQISGNMTR